MKVAISGATGFVGRSLVKQLCENGQSVRCWRRTNSDLKPLGEFSNQIDWVEGELGERQSADELVDGCDAVVHSAFWRQGKGFRGTEGDLVEFCRVNILGTIHLIEAAIAANVSRFVFVSTCAVHEKILSDRPLDEAHPLWALTHYGAHKAAIEKFVHSYGFGMGFPICSIRPTGIYGVHHPVEDSKWYDLITEVVKGNPVSVSGGGKEVHVEDVARGIETLLNADSRDIIGESFACYDQYVSRYEVAQLAKEISESQSEIAGELTSPKNQIVTDKIERLGMRFGGKERLRRTIEQLVTACQSG